MSRIRARTLFLIGAFVASFQLVAAAPASLLPALADFSQRRIRYEQARGALWDGVLTRVTIRGTPVGDIDYAIRPLALATGAVAVVFRVDGGPLNGAGRARLRSGRAELTDAQFDFDLAALAAQYEFLGAPLTGRARADIDRLVITGSGCAANVMRVATDVLKAPAARFGAGAFELSGEGRCAENGDFLLDLSGAGAEGEARLEIRVSPSMTYTLNAAARPAREEVSVALQALGFSYREGELTIAAEGAIGSPGS